MSRRFDTALTLCAGGCSKQNFFGQTEEQRWERVSLRVRRRSLFDTLALSLCDRLKSTCHKGAGARNYTNAGGP